ncbi:MAG: radical SAM family heme chaperone HemW [Gammaproteobacteria bacterium]|nr:radical SAM family heme chaperone HemW [Gammaproteobacteria bacterium]
MPISPENIPLSLYIHVPWCVRKCPYCDFNSHELKDNLPEQLYLAALAQELESKIEMLNGRSIRSIFFGGGTPSLLSGQAIETILTHIRTILPLSTALEITLEANPGTVDENRFKAFFQAGVNRLSLGVQSLQSDKLEVLGRIHDRAGAVRAIHAAQKAGFENINIDLMYGLPQQSIADALDDLKEVMAFKPNHLSWYQLTLEPNTFFYHQPPVLPHEDLIWDMQIAGHALLATEGYAQYEVSAYAKHSHACQHNLNYWQFGDYLGIGPGAHSKLTLTDQVIRFAQVKNPRDYLDANKRSQFNPTPLTTNDLVFEFMLNALRLTEGISVKLFTERTGSTLLPIQDILQEAIKRDLLIQSDQCLCPTVKGQRYLNNLMGMFLP